MSSVPVKKTVFVESMPLAQSHMSGVGHLTLNLINALLNNEQFNNEYELELVVPFNKAKAVKSKFSRPIKVKKIMAPARAIELLMRLHLLPPMDIFIGKGLYIFPNYKNWPLIRSKSYTYIHDLSFIKYPQFVQPKNQRYLKKYVPMWIKRASVVLTLTEYSKKEILETYNIASNKVQVTYVGIDPIFYPRKKEETELIKKRYGITTDKYYLFVGNIEPRKNLSSLIEAFTLLPQSMKADYSLVLIGADSWLKEEIIAKIDAAKEQGFKIIMPNGYVKDEDLPAIYSGATALIHPSFYEGFGIPPIEAMSCDVPTAVSNVEPMPEITNNASVYFNPTDTDSIKKTMVELVSDKTLRDNLIQSGAKQASKFTSAAYSERFMRLLA